MPKEPTRDTRAEILQLARELTQTRGFNWLSFQDISDRLKIRKASVHYHFPNKAALGVVLLRGYRAEFAAWSEKLTGSAASRLRAYFKLFEKIAAHDLNRICPGGIFSVEWNILPKGLREEATGFFDDHRRFVEKQLKAGRRAGEIFFDGSAECEGVLLRAVLQGALQIARVEGRVSTLKKVIVSLNKKYLGS